MYDQMELFKMEKKIIGSAVLTAHLLYKALRFQSKLKRALVT